MNPIQEAILIAGADNDYDPVIVGKRVNRHPIYVKKILIELRAFQLIERKDGNLVLTDYGIEQHKYLTEAVPTPTPTATQPTPNTATPTSPEAPIPRQALPHSQSSGDSPKPTSNASSKNFDRIDREAKEREERDRAPTLPGAVSPSEGRTDAEGEGEVEPTVGSETKPTETAPEPVETVPESTEGETKPISDIEVDKELDDLAAEIGDLLGSLDNSNVARDPGF